MSWRRRRAIGWHSEVSPASKPAVRSLSVQIDADGRSWALMVDLLQRYDLAADWDGDQRRVLIAASDVAPT